MRRVLFGIVAALGMVSFLPSSAGAIGLDILAGGGSLTSGNGFFTFSDFEVVTTGSVGSDLSLYDVSALSDGLALTGPISAADGEAGDLFLAFTVESSVPLESVELRFNGAAAGPGSSASVVETAEGVGEDQAFVYATGGGLVKLIDSMNLPGVSSIRLAKDILVDSSSQGLAVISRIEQHIETAPEPVACLLLLAGLAGLGLRRQQI